MTATYSIIHAGDLKLTAIDDNQLSMCIYIHYIIIMLVLFFLDTNDMKHVLNAVEKLSAKWRLFSVELGIEESTLDLIEHDHSGNAKMCLYNVLREWLKLNYDVEMHGRPSWRRLAEAVKSLDRTLFEKIATEHSK